MKYFTRKEYLNFDKTEEIFSDYREYITENEKALSENLKKYLKIWFNSLTLHDGLFVEGFWDQKYQNVELVFRCGDLQKGYFNLKINYQQASITSDIAIEDILGNAMSEIIIDEIIINEQGKYEHNILFNPAGELNIKFKEFQFQIVRTGTRKVKRSKLKIGIFEGA